MKLKGRAAAVTGGASGMGRAIAQALAADGANVAIGSLTRDRATSRPGEIVNLLAPDDLEKTKSEINALGVQALALPLDVTVPSDAKSFIEAAVSEFGRLDILVNAAGMTCEQLIVDHDDALWLRVIDVNLNGTYYCTKAALPHMIQNKWGRVINISSTAGNVGGPRNGAYCAAKAGVLGLTRALALEVGEHNITVNSICPTWVNTGFGRMWIDSIARNEGVDTNAKLEEIKKTYPQRRIISPEEIGHLARFLAQEESSGISGQDVTVSGGQLW
ncbi:MAG TPA: SDR family NAD(P)-dependent oxidoreductase [Acidobacteriota bacterium]|jgi:NAD(P)-dependent dehydrogenase (short-subunit alcohol dehydrogenase family)